MNTMRLNNNCAGYNQKAALLVVTSHTELNGTDQKTGFWFEEFSTPFWAFYDAGYHVVVASIKGGKVAADPLSSDKEFASASVERFLASKQKMQLLANTICIDDIDSSEYSTIFLCGGHGTLWDFKESRGLARVTSEFYQTDKLIGSVCHGTTGLLSAKKGNAEPLVKGLKMTAFSDSEELLVPEQYIRALPYHLEDALRDQGAIYTKEKTNSPYVVIEKGLITGQNPQSTTLVVKTILDALDKTAIWIDTDFTLNSDDESDPCSIADAYSMISLFNSTAVKVQGISTVFGKSSVSNVYKQVCNISNRFGPIALNVSLGAEQPLYIAQLNETDATTALAKQLKKQKLTIVATGAVTNIASFALLYPELVSQIERVILVAGRSQSQNHFIVGKKQKTPFADMAFESDVDAFRILLDSKIPVVLVPYELANKYMLVQEDLQLLASKGGVGQYLAEHSQACLDSWHEKFAAPGFSPISALAAEFAVNPNSFEYSTVAAEIKILADDTKNIGVAEATSYKPYLIASEQTVSSNNVLMCHDVADDLMATMLQRITRPNDPSKFVSAVSHLNIIVDDVDTAAAFYQRTLGFEQAYDADGRMDYRHLTLSSFAKDAGFIAGKVDVDILFLRHPIAGLYLELMCYHTPKGEQKISLKNTNDMGGIRHAALEVNDVFEAFEYLKDQPGVELIQYPNSQTNDQETTPPLMLNPFPVAFFYWRDPYGVQWEMEAGRKRGHLRGI